MAPLPDHQPKQLSLGPLETEILAIIWDCGSVTAKDIHNRLLADPDRELTYPSVMTVLRRLEKKGWVTCQKQERSLWWKARVSRHDANVIFAHQKLQNFLAIGNPDVVAAFADSLDHGSLDQIEAIAQRLREARQARQSQASPPPVEHPQASQEEE